LTLSKNTNNNFALLCSVQIYNKPFPVKLKKNILSKYNERPDNINGENIRFIILDSGYKEGIDLFDVKYLHIFEPLITASDEKQVIGRGTRFCGQKGLIFEPNIGWPLHVFKYNLLLLPKISSFHDNAHDLFLDKSGIDLSKILLSCELENISKYGAIDYELNKNIHDYGVKSVNTNTNIYTKYKKNILKTNNLASKIKNPLLINKKSKGGGIKGKRNKGLNLNLEKSPNKILKFVEMRNYINERFIKYKWSNIIFKNNCVEEKILIKDKKYKSLGGDGEKTETTCVCTKKSIKTEEEETNKKNEDIEKKKENDSDTDTDSDDDENPVTKKYAEDIMDQRIDDTNFENIKGGKSLPMLSKNKPPSIETKDERLITLSPTQEFVSKYFNSSSAYKGLLLWHSVGTGKTCSAIATATKGFEEHDYTILWVTRHTLKSDIWKNMYNQVCSSVIRRKIINGENIPKNIKGKYLKYLSEKWIMPISYKQFSNMLSEKNQIYKLMTKINGKIDPLKKTLVIIDEAHKLYSPDVIPAERPNIEIMNNKIKSSYKLSGKDSVKLLLMTATPYTNDPMHLIKLINLMKESDLIPENFDEFTSKYLNKEDHTFTNQGAEKYLNSISGYISYLNREKDVRNFAYPVLHNIDVEMSKQSKEITDYEKTETITKKWDTHDIILELDKKISNTENKAEKAKLKKDLKKEKDKVKELTKTIKKEMKEHKKLIENDISQETVIERCFYKRV